MPKRWPAILRAVYWPGMRQPRGEGEGAHQADDAAGSAPEPVGRRASAGGAADETGAFTQLLRGAAGSKDPSPLLRLAYQELRAIARRQLRAERAGHTLQATALVHEAYVKLFGGNAAGRDVRWNDRGHFFAAAAQAMRHVLLEHARNRGRLKRGGGKSQRVSLDAVELARGDGNAVDVLAVDEAIARLEQQDPQMARLVHLRFYAGLGAAETAAALGVSERTVRRDWAFARTWLARELGADGAQGELRG
jgi:RNA polymerase sigma factor (TIGR02999 family)